MHFVISSVTPERGWSAEAGREGRGGGVGGEKGWGHENKSIRLELLQYKFGLIGFGISH